LSPDVTERSAEVPTLRTVTVAPATADPDESRTVPEIVPVFTCPHTGAVVTARIISSNIVLTRSFIACSFRASVAHRPQILDSMEGIVADEVLRGWP
jgi:hypothetical protein